MGKKKLIRFDWAMKHILRDKSNFDILEGFLTAVLKQDVTVLSILESESNQDSPTSKFNRVDLLVENDNGERIIIEIQNERESYYLERLLFGASKVIVDNMMLGESYERVKKVISISILYFLYGEGVDDYVYYGSTEFRGIHSNSLLRLKKREKETLMTFEVKDIFPEYYLIEVEKFQDIINSDLDEWIYFLKHEEIKDDFKAKNILQAKEKLDFLKLNEPDKKTYEKYLMDLAREEDIVETARVEGLEKGEAIGLEKGEAIGLEKGINKGKKVQAFESAKILMQNGVVVEVIMQSTGLTREEIESLG